MQHLGAEGSCRPQHGAEGSTRLYHGAHAARAGCRVWLRRLLIQKTIPGRLHCGAEGCVKLNGEAKGCCRLRVMVDCTVKDKGMARVRAGPLGDDNVPYGSCTTEPSQDAYKSMPPSSPLGCMKQGVLDVDLHLLTHSLILVPSCFWLPVTQRLLSCSSPGSKMPHG